MREKGLIMLALALIIAMIWVGAAMSEQKIKNGHAVAGFSGSQDYGGSRLITVTKDYDTTDAGMHWDTIDVADSMKIPIFGYDEVRSLFYEVQTYEYSDNRCTVYVDWFFGCNDTNRLMPEISDLITGSDSTYDSIVVHNTCTYFNSDSLMFMDWIGMRVIVGMHNWKASGADSSNDSYDAVLIKGMEARLRDD